LPDTMSAVDAAPLMCAGVTIYRALKRCQLSAGQRVGIVGAGGGLGHLGLQFAEAMGLRTTGVDAADGPLQLAKSLGLKAEIIDAKAVEADKVVQKMGEEDGEKDRANMGLDAVIILPESQASFEYGCKLLKK
jgi:D-arabinose 1-dehydrogenase-like Zn-dependent alcohol dehydrogenase